MAAAKKNTAKQGVSGSYTADDMRELSGLEPIRQSPAQYIGSIVAVSQTKGRNAMLSDDEVLTAGGFHLFVEACGNASDEATNAGADGKTYADRIDVILHADQSITIQDNGRGIPPDINKATGKSGIEMAYLTMNAGGKFKDRNEKKAGNYKTAQGLHGVGAACVAALSDRLDVTVWRDGKEYNLSAKQGVPGTFEGDEIRSKFKPFEGKGSAVTSKKDSRKAAEKKGWETGTRVHWHPDPLIWGGTDLPIKDIYDYIEAQSYMAPAATYRIVDETGIEFEGHLGKNPEKGSGKPRVTEFHKPGGINDMIDEKTAKTSNLSPVISFDVPASYTKTVAVENDDGTMGQTSIDYDCDVKVALRWTSKSGPDIEGYANGVHCIGKHVDGFRRGMSRALTDWVKKSGAMTKQDEKNGIQTNIDDITDGLVACIEVLLEDQCDFLGQTKENLTNAEVISCVSDAVKEQMTTWLSAKKNAAAAKKIAKSVLENARLRAKQKKEKENAKKIKEFEKNTSWPEKLTNCSCYDDPRSELIIVEGDSAANPARSQRVSSKYQAIFAIRGKIKNTYDMPLQGSGRKKGVLDNEEAAAILKIQHHYHNIIILSDADPDGAHIEMLVYTLFYKHIPEVVQEGRIFAVEAPLYVIEESKTGTQHPALNDREKDKICADLKKKKIEYTLSRIKGWGEGEPELVRTSCLDPETRVLRRITIADMEKAEKILATAMSGNKENAENRKEWLIEQLGYGNVQLFD